MNRRILYYSTNGKAEKVGFGEALLKGLAPDKGLFMPDHVPVLDENTIHGLKNKPYYHIAYTIARHYLKDEIPDNDLLGLVKDAYDFEIPLEQVYERKYILRLDRGPTASFKDFAARLMGRMMQYYLKKQNREMLILTATSGDTGSAIANAFYGLNNIKVVILFPKDEVTLRQRRQMTTLRENIKILSLNGKFDDCQALVKRAFTDPDLEYLNLSSANSINIGRLLPQSFYYFYAWSQLATENPDDPAVFSVPSGNFGNMMGGLLARKMGLPVKRFVISTNENNEVPVYWKTGNYSTIIPSKNCISSAMNVGHPSNMARIVALYEGIMDENGRIIKQPDMIKMREDIFAVSISDKQTADTIKEIYSKYRVLTEPHGAAGWAGLTEYFRIHPEDANRDQLSISLETAHPAKFPEEIIRLLDIDPELPPSMKDLDHLDESFEEMENNYNSFKTYLSCNY